jgi:hypothetical protein
MLKDEGILSFSDHYMKKKEIMASVTGEGGFRLLKKGENLYKFAKVTV